MPGDSAAVHPQNHQLGRPALGHFGSTGYLLSALVGKAVGKGSPSIEELKVPKTLNFLRDSSVAISLTMMILFVALVLVAGKEFTESQ